MTHHMPVALEGATQDLYRFFDRQGQTLYIGVSVCAVTRAAQHSKTAAWWGDVARMEVEKVHASRAEALALERAAIKAERPIHNVVHNQDDGPLATRDDPSELRPFSIFLGDHERDGRYFDDREPTRLADVAEALRADPAFMSIAGYGTKPHRVAELMRYALDAGIVPAHDVAFAIDQWRLEWIRWVPTVTCPHCDPFEAYDKNVESYQRPFSRWVFRCARGHVWDQRFRRRHHGVGWWVQR